MTTVNVTRILTVFLFATFTTVLPEEVRGAETLRIATSTSAVNSGLLNYLLPVYTEESEVSFEVSVVGSGQALRMGRRGEVDVTLTHAPDAEAEFVSSGSGIRSVPVMKNAYVVVGPLNDPAKVAQAGTIREALESILESHPKFVSRGDDSGTHKKELSLWHSFGQRPFGPTYFEAGLGMKSTLALANQMQAYTLVDSATWLSLRSNLNLAICYQSDEVLLQNPYSIIAVNPATHAANSIQLELALEFIAWITSPPVQSLIGNFEVENTRLFHPMAEGAVE